MHNYLENLNEEIREYFKILSPDFPDWLEEYIETPAMQRIGKISINCGADYTNLFKVRYWYSNLEHSVGVALIIWNFTHDKKQTLSGLFHDIATPTFKHCIDFLNNDHEKQESTEAMTEEILRNSKEIMNFLKKDQIKLEEVSDYKLYPIADNETPMLSADRFEYTFSSGLVFHRVWELDAIKECYDNVFIGKNENNNDELTFKDLNIAEKYIRTAAKLWPQWVSNADKVMMQFIADMVKILVNRNIITINDLYVLSEEEVINLVLSCEDSALVETFKNFQNNAFAYESDTFIDNKYCISVGSKKRYVNPLVACDLESKRISQLSLEAKGHISNYLLLQGEKYTYLPFQFDVVSFLQNNKPKTLRKEYR